jgi:hypothetical protein
MNNIEHSSQTIPLSASPKKLLSNLETLFEEVRLLRDRLSTQTAMAETFSEVKSYLAIQWQLQTGIYQLEAALKNIQEATDLMEKLSKVSPNKP